MLQNTYWITTIRSQSQPVQLKPRLQYNIPRQPSNIAAETPTGTRYNCMSCAYVLSPNQEPSLDSLQRWKMHARDALAITGTREKCDDHILYKQLRGTPPIRGGKEPRRKIKHFEKLFLKIRPSRNKNVKEVLCGMICMGEEYCNVTTHSNRWKRAQDEPCGGEHINSK